PLFVPPLGTDGNLGHQCVCTGTGNFLQKRTAAAMPDLSGKLLHIVCRVIEYRRVDSRVTRTVGIGAGNGREVVPVPVLQSPAVSEYRVIRVEYFHPVEEGVHQLGKSRHPALPVGMGQDQRRAWKAPADIVQRCSRPQGLACPVNQHIAELGGSDLLAAHDPEVVGNARLLPQGCELMRRPEIVMIRQYDRLQSLAKDLAHEIDRSYGTAG